jgi:hypothetical protein
MWKIYLHAGKFTCGTDNFFGVNVGHIWLLSSIRSSLPLQHNPPPSLSATAAVTAAAMAAG